AAGVATGGSVVLFPLNIDATTGISLINIPAQVTVTATNFTTANTIKVTSTGPAVQTIVAGTFSAPGGVTIQTPALQLSTTGNTGLISSTSGDINITSTGALIVSGSGRIQAPGYAVNLTAGSGALSLTGTGGGP